MSRAPRCATARDGRARGSPEGRPQDRAGGDRRRPGRPATCPGTAVGVRPSGMDLPSGADERPLGSSFPDRPTGAPAPGALVVRALVTVAGVVALLGLPLLAGR